MKPRKVMRTTAIPDCGYTVILDRWGYWSFRGIHRLAHRHVEEHDPALQTLEDGAWYITHQRSCAKCGEFPPQEIEDTAKLLGILHE